MDKNLAVKIDLQELKSIELSILKQIHALCEN